MKPFPFLAPFFICFFFTIALAQAPDIDLGPAAPYNGFFFENFTAPSSDTQGRLAIGMHGSLNHYSVGGQLDPTNAGNVLVVGGDLTYPNGRVYFGNILVGGSAAGVGSPVINGMDPGAQLIEGDALPLDFAAAESQLQATSLSVSGFATNTTF